MSVEQLSAQQIQQLQRVFRTLDHDADGVVSEADVAKVLRNLGAWSGPAARLTGRRAEQRRGGPVVLLSLIHI